MLADDFIAHNNTFLIEDPAPVPPQSIPGPSRHNDPNEGTIASSSQPLGRSEPIPTEDIARSSVVGSSSGSSPKTPPPHRVPEAVSLSSPSQPAPLPDRLSRPAAQQPRPVSPPGSPTRLRDTSSNHGSSSSPPLQKKRKRHDQRVEPANAVVNAQADRTVNSPQTGSRTALSERLPTPVAPRRAHDDLSEHRSSSTDRARGAVNTSHEATGLRAVSPASQSVRSIVKHIPTD